MGCIVASGIMREVKKLREQLEQEREFGMSDEHLAILQREIDELVYEAAMDCQ